MTMKLSSYHGLSQILDPACPEDKQVFFVTYGFGSTLEGCYSSLYATDVEEARALAFRTTQGKHAFLYEPPMWVDGGQTQAEKYSLRLVPLQPQKHITPLNRKYL